MSLWAKEVEPAYPEVANYASLPLPADAINMTYLVLTTVGLDLAGLYHSDGIAWFYLGDVSTTMLDGTFLIQNSADNTKQMDFDVSAVSIGTTKTLKMSNYDQDLTNPIVKTEGFDIASDAPLHTEGLMFYDNVKHALSYYNEEADVTVNIGQEMLIRVRNETGTTIVNGSAVYPSGVSIGGEVLIGLATSSDKNKCRLVGIVTHDIEDASNGYVTKFGEVADLNTLAFSSGDVVYLSNTPGAFTKTKPTGVSFITQIGAIKAISATVGSIVVDINTTEFSVEASQTVGWSPNKTATMAFNNTNRTLTITPVDTNFVFYQYGDQYSKTIDTYQIPNTEGLFLIYYNLGTLTHILAPTEEQVVTLIKNNPFAAFVYWNVTNSKNEYFATEMHGIGMAADTHAYLHEVNGLTYLSGLLPNGIISEGNGSLNSHAQFGITAGGYVDEDLYYATSAIASTVGLPIKYLSGTSIAPILRTITNAGYSISTTGTGRLAYNFLTGGNWTIAEVPSADFVCCHVCVNNSSAVAERVFAFMGQATYGTVALARIGAQTELLNLQIAGVITEEIKAIATFVFETNLLYLNDVNARIREINATSNFIDWRNTKVAGTNLS